MREEGEEMLESLEKLRDFRHYLSTNEAAHIADEIQAEIDAKYMLLPLDADGVPIHVGEEMACHGDVFKVCAVARAKIHRWVTVKLGETQTTYSYDPLECTHYKPRTVEDVLIEYRLKAYNLYACQELTGEERVYEFMKLDAEYDSEIRELLRSDE